MATFCRHNSMNSNGMLLGGDKLVPTRDESTFERYSSINSWHLVAYAYQSLGVWSARTKADLMQVVVLVLGILYWPDDHEAAARIALQPAFSFSSHSGAMLIERINCH